MLRAKIIQSNVTHLRYGYSRDALVKAKQKCPTASDISDFSMSMCLTKYQLVQALQSVVVSGRMPASKFRKTSCGER